MKNYAINKYISILIIILFFSVILSINSNGNTINSKSYSKSFEIPKNYYDLSKAPTKYIDFYDKSKYYFEEFNFPIGNFGNNYISYSPHGIDRIALYNNYFDSFGGDYGTGSYNPRCLNGTFLGVYMENGEEKISRILQKHSPTNRSATDLGLETLEDMDCFSNIPIGYYKYYDSEFSADIGLTVFSPLLPYDLKNSSIPSSVWIFNAYNPTDTPVDVSFLFSLENDIGWRHKYELKEGNIEKETTKIKYFWQRNGTYNYIKETDDLIGIIYTYDEDITSKSNPEYLGNMTLATVKQPNVTITYISEWQTLGDGKDLLDSFKETGMLINQNNTEQAVEDEKIYAGALSAKFTLAPKESKNIPFVLSTCFPIFNLSNQKSMSSNDFYKWSWTQYFDNSWDIAKYTFENYYDWLNEIEAWHESLYKSGLPNELVTYLIGGLSTFVSKVFFSDDPYWFTYSFGFESMQPTTYSDWFLCMYYPEVEKIAIKEFCKTIDGTADGFCPGSLWDVNNSLRLHQDLSFIIRAYRAWLWNQNDEMFLSNIYSTCKNVTLHRINRDVGDDGLIDNKGNDVRNDGWSMPKASCSNSLWLLNLRIMQNMADELKIYDDEQFYKKLFEKAQNSFIETFWHKSYKYEYFKLCAKKIGIWAFWKYPKGFVTYPEEIPLIGGIPMWFMLPILDSKACMIEQIYGVWHGRLMDIDILPISLTKTALNSIYKINYDYSKDRGWINGVMGNPPYIIDRFGVYYFNMANRIESYCQWSFASSLLSHDQKNEALNVTNITLKNNLYEKGGVYFGEDFNVFLAGTNKINRQGSSPLDWISNLIYWNLNKQGKVRGSEDHLGPPYPPRVLSDAPSWSLYQAAAGFTPCVGGLKIKPRIGGDNKIFITQFAGCKIMINVKGKGDSIISAEINGEPYNTFIDENLFIPLEKFFDRKEMFVSVYLS